MLPTQSSSRKSRNHRPKNQEESNQDLYKSHFFNETPVQQDKEDTAPDENENHPSRLLDRFQQSHKANTENLTEPTNEKKSGRFNGLSETQVSKRTLVDHLAPNLDIIVIGINPGLQSAYEGHHYAGSGNHFWKCLHLSGLTAQQMHPRDGYKLLQVGIGLTNMVARATKGIADLSREEMKEGALILLGKLRELRPKIAVFNGKMIYEVFSGKKDFLYGKQPEFVEGTNSYIWVMPSSSARSSLFPRAEDKVVFYLGLKKFRDYLNGAVASVDESEVVFGEIKRKVKRK